MALPKLGSGTPRLRTDLSPRPTQSVQQAGLVGNAVVKLGQQVSEFGTTLLAKRQAAKKNEFISRQMIDLYDRAADIDTEAQNSFSDDHEGYSDFVRSKMEKEINSLGKNAPFGTAQEEFTLKANSLLASSVNRANAFENKRRAEFYQESDNLKISESSYGFFKQPDLTRGAEVAQELGIHFQGNVDIIYNQDQADIKNKSCWR